MRATEEREMMALKAEELPMLIKESRNVITALRMIAFAGTLTFGLILEMS
jgi:hypothetical protein